MLERVLSPPPFHEVAFALNDCLNKDTFEKKKVASKYTFKIEVHLMVQCTSFSSGGCLGSGQHS